MQLATTFCFIPNFKTFNKNDENGMMKCETIIGILYERFNTCVAKSGGDVDFFGFMWFRSNLSSFAVLFYLLGNVTDDLEVANYISTL